MRDFRKRTAVEQVADAIVAEITAGRLSGLMPSIRSLADKYKVSVPTLHKARAILQRRGVLENRGDKRRLVIVAPATQRVASVLVFHGKDPDQLFANYTLSLQAAASELAEKGISCAFESLHGLAPAAVASRIAESLLFRKPTHCVLLFGTPAMASQLRRARVKLALMGGHLRAQPGVVRLGVSFFPLIDHAVTQLRALGHRRFFIPYLRRPGTRTEAEAEVRRIADAHGVRLSVLWSHETARDTLEMERHLDVALEDRATALIFPQWADFIYAIGYAERRGLNIPRDFSVVVLINGALGYLHRPALAHYTVKSDFMRRQLMAWVQQDGWDEKLLVQQVLSTWTPGETVGPAPVMPLETSSPEADAKFQVTRTHHARH